MLSIFKKKPVEPPQPDPQLELLKLMVENQQKSHEQSLGMMQTMMQASQAQSQVLSDYLKLFKVDGAPERWTSNEEADTLEEMEALGFPKDGSQKAQAEWVISHMDKL